MYELQEDPEGQFLIVYKNGGYSHLIADFWEDDREMVEFVVDALNERMKDGV